MCEHHVNRRQALVGISSTVAALILSRISFASEPAHEAPQGAAPAPAAHAPPAGITPDEALNRLKAGNARFVGSKMEHPNLTAKRITETSTGQHPFATIISCSDSRVPAEEVFDRGIGDLFVIRVAGNVVHTDELGTAEYGSGHLGVSLIVVMGHTKCGAVTAVVKGDKVGGSIPKLVGSIVPVAERVKAKGLTGDALILETTKENVRQGITDLTASSDELLHLVKSGKVKIVGALYHVEDGQVEWL
ncbi:MAG: carbonic anhydrase [Magnetococcales bacterium]|nr:carbonic anhydrase [Magnetococcales bacterium]